MDVPIVEILNVCDGIIFSRIAGKCPSSLVLALTLPLVPLKCEHFIFFQVGLNDAADHFHYIAFHDLNRFYTVEGRVVQEHVITLKWLRHYCPRTELLSVVFTVPSR
jgi:hypothetical protein